MASSVKRYRHAVLGAICTYTHSVGRSAAMCEAMRVQRVHAAAAQAHHGCCGEEEHDARDQRHDHVDQVGHGEAACGRA